MQTPSVAPRYHFPGVLLKHPHHRVGLAGFTLIEMVIVLAILGLACALLLPALSIVKESARAVRCGSNLRQFGIASVMYSQDWKGLALPVVNSAGMGATWPYIFAGYLETESTTLVNAANTHNFVRSCPSWTMTSGYQSSVTNATNNPYIGYGRIIFLRYPMPAKTNNRYLNGDGNLHSGYGDYNNLLIRVSNVSQRVQFSDNNNYVLWPAFSTMDQVFTRHRGKANALYFDGHLELRTGADIKAAAETR